MRAAVNGNGLHVAGQIIVDMHDRLYVSLLEPPLPRSTYGNQPEMNRSPIWMTLASGNRTTASPLMWIFREWSNVISGSAWAGSD